MSTDMFPDDFIKYVIEQHEENQMNESDNTICQNCGKTILITINKNTGYCCELCRKALAGEIDRPGAQTDAGITNILNQPRGEVDLGGIR